MQGRGSMVMVHALRQTHPATQSLATGGAPARSGSRESEQVESESRERRSRGSEGAAKLRLTRSDPPTQIEECALILDE